MNIHDADIINLLKILDKRGNLSIIKEFKNVHFKDTMYLLDI